MNSVKRFLLVTCKSKSMFFGCLFFILFFSFYFVGCGDQVHPPSPSQLTEFKYSGPLQLTVDESKLVKAKISGGPYRVSTNEVLELTMPSILQVVTTEESVNRETNAPYICRVNENGNITLPVIGEIEVAGKTLAEIESAIIKVYYPEYTVRRPSVFARVIEYDTARVSISGAVRNPGVYSLRRDQMSLVALLMEAGGIIEEGAALIRIDHAVDRSLYDNRESNNDTIRPIQQISNPIEVDLNDYIVNYPNFEDIKIRFNYKLFNSSGRKGILYISYDKIILLKEELDITSRIERLVLLDLLSKKEPWIPILHVNQKLCELAELLESGSGRSQCIVNIPCINNGIKYEIINSSDWICHGRSRKKIPRFVNADLKYRSVYSGRNVYGSGIISSEPGILRNSSSVVVEFETSFTMQRYFQDFNISGGNIKTIAREQNTTIRKQNELKDRQHSESIVLPIKGLNIPFADVVLQDGDKVIVERLQIPLFTVIGLVNSPGNFEYPPDAQYNLMQALAFSGGLNQVAEPRYVTVYRLKADGDIISVIFKLVETGRGPSLTDALNVRIKPGDIISVEHTPRTRTNMFIDRIFRVNIGTYFSLNDAWDNN